MILRIADLQLQVAWGEDVLRRLPNLQPFVDAAGAGLAAPICRVASVEMLPEEAGAPVLTSHLEGRTLRLWIAADHCGVSLASAGGRHIYRLRADRHWTQVETDWRPDSDEAYAALNDFVMIAFIYSASFHRVVLLHASCVMADGRGAAFVGPSGIGKSTHSRLWLAHVPGAELLNDDQPALRIGDDGMVRLYGTPWSGKTPCYRNKSVPLVALFRMVQASRNRAVRQTGIDTFKILAEGTSLIGQDGVSFAAISETMARIASIVSAYRLENRPDEEAVRLSYGLFADGQTQEKR